MNTNSRARAEIMRLLEERGPGKTICPSEAARSIASDARLWREELPAVHGAVDAMLARGEIALSWKGEKMERRRGPYRISRS